MEQYETRMSNLLSDLKDLMKDYGNGTKGTTLSNIKTFKRGIFNQNVVFPVLSIIPINEVITERRSSLQQVVQRLIKIEIYNKSGDPRRSVRSSLDYEEIIRNIFYDSSYPFNYQLQDADDDNRPTVFNFNIGTYDYEGEEGNLIQLLSLPVSFLSYEYPSSYTVGDQIEEETKDLSDVILTQLKTVSDVKIFPQSVLPPIPISSGIVICLNEIKSDDDHYELGRDREIREFHIYVWSKLKVYEPSFSTHLDKVDDVKDILHSNSQWGGRSWMSNIHEINHGVNEQQMLYGSQIIYKTNTRRVLPSY